MFFTFLIFTLSELTSNSSVDDSFVRVLTDANWIENKKRIKEGFIFFHAPHQRISDTGYLRYVYVSKQYRKPKEDRFYVVNGIYGDKIAREFRIPGWPALFYYKNPTGKDPEYVEYHGPMSTDNLQTFIYNFTRSGFTDVNVSDTISFEDIIRLSFRDEYETASTGFIFGKNDTKFVRVCEEFAKKHCDMLRFIHIDNEVAAKNIGMRIPSLLIFRIEDHETFIYKGEPKLSLIEEWYKKNVLNSIHISEFNQYELFEMSGLTLKTVVENIPRDERIAGNETFNSLKSLYHYRTPLILRYADPNEMRAFYRLFDIDQNIKRLCIASNYTRIAAYDCSEGDPFPDKYQENLTFLQTPSDLYGGIAFISETSFEKFIDDGPIFTLFVTNKNCPMCGSMEYYFEEAYASLKDTLPENISFAIWRVTDVNRPSFSGRISINYPSVYFFPTHSFSESSKFNRERDTNGIKTWISMTLDEYFNPQTDDKKSSDYTIEL